MAAPTGMILDGVAGAQVRDSSSEVLDIYGADISEPQEGKSNFVWEHRTGKSIGDDDKPGPPDPADIVGRILYAKKIFEKKDCDDERQRKYWMEVEAPFIYIVGRLYDGAGHEPAKQLAAMIRDHVANGEPITARFSVDGSTLEKTKDGVLKRTVVRRVAITLRPCNHSAFSGLVLDPNAPPGFDKEPAKEAKGILAQLESVAKSEDPFFGHIAEGGEVGIIDDLSSLPVLSKALTGGGADAAPSTLTGGDALAKEDSSLRKRKVEAVCKSALRDSQTEGRSAKDILRERLSKANLGEVSQEFLDYFEEKAQGLKAKLSKAEGGVTDEESEGKIPTRMTVQGKAIKPPKQKLPRGYAHVDEEKGVLTTDRGVFKLYNPEEDRSMGVTHSGRTLAGQHFEDAWGDEHIRDVHRGAIKNWLRIHEALKTGKLPEAVVATAAAFSILSTNTPVPVHELMAGYLYDTMRHKGVDLRDKGFGTQGVYEDWVDRDQPHSTPESSQDYFMFDIDPLITLQNDTEDRVAGERPSFQLAANKFARMAQYAGHHRRLVDTFAKHGVDGRSLIAELMESKRLHVSSSQANARRKKNRQPLRPPLGIDLPGLAPKTSRFLAAMAGAGNTIVPDTHMVRHLFGLDKDVDGPTANYLKQRVMWRPKNFDVLGAIDRWYLKNHPAAKLFLQSDQGQHFKLDPEQAIFPSFWGHWLAISGHESLMGHRDAAVAYNATATHRPYFDEVHAQMEDPKELAKLIPIPLKKSEAVPGGPMIHPVHAAALLRDWVDQVGETAALANYYAYLVPLLHPDGKQSPGVTHDRPVDLVKAEALSVDLRRAAILAKQEQSASGTADYRPPAGALPQGMVSAPRGLVDAVRHGHPMNNSDAQRKLIHGLDLTSYHPGPSHDHGLGISDSAWRVSAAGTPVIVKRGGHDDAATEVAYHNAARDFFGMGKFVPTTSMALVDYGGVTRPIMGWASVQEAVPDSEAVARQRNNTREIDTEPGSSPATSGGDSTAHWRHTQEPWSITDEKHRAWLRHHAESGDLDKLAIMNMALGNTDRHSSNYVLTPHAPYIRMIDHGRSLGWDVFGTATVIPRYLHAASKAVGRELMTEPLHPAAAQWAQGLDPAKLSEHLAAWKFEGQLSRAHEHAAKALATMQAALRQNPQLTREGLLRSLQDEDGQDGKVRYQ